MKRSRRIVLNLFGCALVIGCAKSSGDETETSTTSTSTTTSSASGSVTSAPGSATDASTATSTASVSTSSGSTGETCPLFICSDMLPVTDECDVWTQNCPEGQKCVPYISDGGGAWDALKCVEVTGVDKPGDACIATDVANGLDSCIKGAMCWGVKMDGTGVCVGLCSGSYEAPVCDPPGACSFGRVFNLCFPTCDPLLQDCGGPADACYPIDDGFTCVPDGSGAEGQANDPCEFINVCDPGLMCGDPAFVGMGCPPGSQGCCTPFCPFPDGACPNPDQQCIQYFDPMQIPENDPLLGIGVCGVPG